MADYQYAIGEDPGEMLNLEDDLGVMPPHPAPFLEWATSYETGTGMMQGDGWPSCEWHFDFLDATMLATLRTYCPNKSAVVYITTLKADLTTYGTFQAVMIWPDDRDYRMGRAVTDFTIQFTHLEEID